MSFEHHPQLTEPAEDARAWRYMDFTKYVSILHKRSLYFSNLEYLASSDPHEGLLAQPNYRHRQWRSIADLDLEDQAVSRVNDDKCSEEIRQQRFLDYRAMLEDKVRRSFAMRKSYYASCWHMSDHESAAMWSIYAGQGSGIAVTSNFGRVKKAFESSQERVFISLIRYIDYIIDRVPEHNGFFPIIHKRMDFEYEREFRIIHWDTDVSNRSMLVHKVGSDPKEPAYDYKLIERPIEEIENIKPRSGLYISCEIDDLIEDIYVSPGSPIWFAELVASVTRRYGVVKPVRRSGITAPPLR